jgi:hypothetical protein
MAAIGPAFMLTTERYAPSFSGKGAFPMAFRLSCAVGLLAGAGLVYQTSCCTSNPGELEPGEKTEADV